MRKTIIQVLTRQLVERAGGGGMALDLLKHFRVRKLEDVADGLQVEAIRALESAVDMLDAPASRRRRRK